MLTDLFKALGRVMRLKPQSKQSDINFRDSRYPMTSDQPCQIDCRAASCIFNKGAGVCGNVSPAITLNGCGTFVCWSEIERE
jgi:hypothetical protein